MIPSPRVAVRKALRKPMSPLVDMRNSRRTLPCPSLCMLVSLACRLLSISVRTPT